MTNVNLIPFTYFCYNVCMKYDFNVIKVNTVSDNYTRDQMALMCLLKMRIQFRKNTCISKYNDIQLRR